MGITGPIVLVGNNLGQRHRYLNNLVNDLNKNGVPFETISMLPEKSPVDRLFKIDLAAKYCNIDYILNTLKDENMLFVSKALKCAWLLEEPYSNVIHPEYLETKLFPEMLTIASNKMKHWISLHLKDENRCKLFYEYYKTIDIDFALKFFLKAPKNFLIKEILEIPEQKITPHLLKLLCEQLPEVADIFFNKICNDYAEESFIKSIQLLLKRDPELYFQVLESTFYHTFKRLSKKATEYIMKYHKDRYLEKPELYAGWILHLLTLAKFLNESEIKSIVKKLTNASYLQKEFTYKTLEPLVKKIDPKERNSFCKTVFEDKHINLKVDTAPYPMRTTFHKTTLNINRTLAATKDYDQLLEGPHKIPVLRGGGGPFVSQLDALFNEYRFMSFEATLASLRKKLRTEGSMAGRQNIMLVLVSKSGGQIKTLQELLDLLVPMYLNEPANVRAAIVRSLVKKAAVWRLPSGAWDQFLEFAHGLGLDGSTPDVPCDEGFHAVVLHHTINKKCFSSQAMTERFLKNFSNLSQYSLTDEESLDVKITLATFLFVQAKKYIKHSPQETKNILTNLVDVIHIYNGSEYYAETIPLIEKFVKKYPEHAEPILRKLFDAHEARVMFFKYNFHINQSDASYLNALRHDASILRTGKEFRELISDDDLENLNHVNFFRKVAVYFSEEGGLANVYADALKLRQNLKPHAKLAKSIKTLTEISVDGRHSTAPFTSADNEPPHKKPRVDFVLKEDDLVSVANWIQRCSRVSLLSNIVTLLSEPRWALLVIALRAAQWPALIAGTIPAAARGCPIRAARLALRIMRKNPNCWLSKDWQALKFTLVTLKLKTQDDKLLRDLVKINDVPDKFKLDFCITLYELLHKYDIGGGIRRPSYLYALPLVSYINDNWTQLDKETIENILVQFLNTDFTLLRLEQNFDSDGSMYGVFNGYTKCGHRRYTDEVLREYYYHLYVSFLLKLFAKFLIKFKCLNDIVECYIIMELFLPNIKLLWNNSKFHSSCKLLRFSMYKPVRNERVCQTFFYEFLRSFCDSRRLTKSFLKGNTVIPALKFMNNLCETLCPIHESFTGNYLVKFSLIYIVTLKGTARQMPHLFTSKVNLCEEALNMVSLNFGIDVALDLEMLVANNFQSIRNFYAATLYRYLCETHLDNTFVIKGLFKDTRKLNALYLGLYLITKCGIKMHFDQRLLLSRTKDVNFFLFAQLYENIFNDNKTFPRNYF